MPSMSTNRARGWRRIGIVLSVIWFLSFGLFLWSTFVNDVVRPVGEARNVCGLILDGDNDNLQYLRSVEERNTKQAANFAKYEKCQADAQINWERTRPADRLLAAMVLGIDLVTIGIGWLLVWLVVLIVRWIWHGFAST